MFFTCRFQSGWRTPWKFQSLKSDKGKTVKNPIESNGCKTCLKDEVADSRDKAGSKDGLADS
jgi:hypothetical protein